MSSDWLRRLATKCRGSQSAAGGPTLDDVIPPEIVGDAFATAIETVAADPRVREILEIGSSSGNGSTEAWVRGALRNPATPRLHCVEVSVERYTALVERWRDQPFVHCYNLSSVPVEAFPSPDDVYRFYEETPSKLRAFPVEQVVGWLRQDVDYVVAHGLSAPGIRRIKEEHDLETFDAVLIDGSEFTGASELDEVYGARFLLLDDTETFKNWQTSRRLADDPRYSLVASDRNTRNGFAVFERVD
jgi:hypothetical protein